MIYKTRGLKDVSLIYVRCSTTQATTEITCGTKFSVLLVLSTSEFQSVDYRYKSIVSLFLFKIDDMKENIIFAWKELDKSEIYQTIDICC